MNVLKAIFREVWQLCKIILLFVYTAFIVLLPVACGLFLVYTFGDAIDPGGVYYHNSGQLVKSGPMETSGGAFAGAMLFFVGIIIGAAILFVSGQLFKSVINKVHLKLGKE